MYNSSLPKVVYHFNASYSQLAYASMVGTDLVCQSVIVNSRSIDVEYMQTLNWRLYTKFEAMEATRILRNELKRQQSNKKYKNDYKIERERERSIGMCATKGLKVGTWK